MASQHSSLPVRSETLRSSDAGYVTDEEAIPETSPSNTAGLLLERLRAWKHCCADLETYVKGLQKTLKDHSKDYSKVIKNIEPLREGYHFDQSLGGITGLFENLRTNTQAISNSYLDASKNLDAQVLPILERLHKEIKEKSSELNKGAGKAADAVDSATTETQKRIEAFGQSTSSFSSVGGKVDASSDPYVAQRGIRHMLNKQIIEENNSRQDLIAVEKNFQVFETHVVTHIQQAFEKLQLLTGGRAEKEKIIFTDIAQTAQAIPADFEWNKFLGRSGDLMVNPNAPPREMSHMTWPNMDHASTKPLIAGTLERKGRGVGALAGYKSGYYVVTASKFLHQFESDDDFAKEPSPELSLFLPDCTVGGVSGDKFNVKGKDVSKGKIGQAFQMSHEIAFKAHSSADAHKWRDIIATTATSTEDLPLDSAVTSPISPTAADRLPPPNTDVPARQVLDGNAAGSQPVAGVHPSGALPTQTVAHGQTGGGISHPVATPTAPTTATTTSPGAEVLGQGPHAA